MTGSRLSKAVYLRRRIVVFGAAAAVLVAGLFGVGYTVQAADAPLPAATAAVTTPEVPPGPPASPDWPEFRAAAVGAVGFDGVLASTGEQGVVPIASITKTITSLVLLDAKPIPAGSDGPVIEFTQRDVDLYRAARANDESWAPVTAGERLSLRDALTAMLLPSANNYAVSLTDWAFGSQEAYLAAARDWLDRHGLTHTRLADSSGLDPGSASTPAELVEIAKLVVTNDVLASIVATESVTLPGVGTEANTNKILGVAGIDGIKTGFTDEAGHCLLFSADAKIGQKTVQLVGVALGAGSYGALWDRVPPLVESVAAGFREVTVATAGQRLGTVTTAWGESSPVVAADTITMLVFGDVPVTATARVTAPRTAEAGERIGSLDVAVGDHKAGTELTVSRAIEAPDLWWRLTHPEELAAR